MSARPAPDQRPDQLPVHPEPVAGHADTLRWIVPPGLLPCGAVRRAPGALGALLTSGVLADPLVERAGVWLRLTAGSWRERGAEVRTALQEALLEPAGWEVDAPDDAGLLAVTEDVLAGPVGDYVASHGGRIEVARVSAGVVEVDLVGTCAHCPAAGLTLHARIEDAVRERWPDLVAIRDVTGGAESHNPVAAREALSRWLHAFSVE